MKSEFKLKIYAVASLEYRYETESRSLILTLKFSGHKTRKKALNNPVLLDLGQNYWGNSPLISVIESPISVLSETEIPEREEDKQKFIIFFNGEWICVKIRSR